MNQKLIGIAVIGCLFGIVGCAAEERQSTQPAAQTTESTQQDQVEEPVVMIADDPLAGTASLTDIASASDLVLVGRATSIETGVQLGGGLPPYTLVTLEQQEVIRGEAPKVVKVMMQTETDTGRPLVVEGRPEFTDEASLWMLTSVDPSFDRPEGEYVLTSTSGLIPGKDGQVLLPEDDLTPSQDEAQDLGTIAKVADQIQP